MFLSIPTSVLTHPNLTSKEKFLTAALIHSQNERHTYAQLSARAFGNAGTAEAVRRSLVSMEAKGVGQRVPGGFAFSNGLAKPNPTPGLCIEHDIITDRHLSDGVKLVAQASQSFTKASPTWIANKIGLSPRTTRRYLDRLKLISKPPQNDRLPPPKTAKKTALYKVGVYIRVYNSILHKNEDMLNTGRSGPETQGVDMLTEGTDGTWRNPQPNPPVKKRAKARSDVVRRIKARTKKPITPARTSPLLEHWNILPGAPHHKNRETKVYRNASSMLRDLRDGRLFRVCRLANHFRLKHKLSKATLYRTYTDKEIRQALSSLAKIFRPGIYPENKDHLPRNLPDLIFNPRTGTSWFLLVATYGAEPLPEKKTDRLLKDDDIHYAYTAFKRFVVVNGGDGDLVRRLKELRQAYDSTIKQTMDGYLYHNPYLGWRGWIEGYARFIDDLYDTDRGVDVTWIGPQQKSYWRFVRDVEDELEITLIKKTNDDETNHNAYDF